MSGRVITHRPGSLRRVARWGEEPKLWGSLDEQIAEATAANRAAWSQQGHTPKPLYTMVEDCPHTNPEDDERFDGVNDLTDEWLSRLGISCESRWTHLWWINYQRALTVIPLAGEYAVAQREYDATHNQVCLDSPVGFACSDPDCQDGDEDFGIEPGGCRLRGRAREAWGELWWSVSPDR